MISKCRFSFIVTKMASGVMLTYPGLRLRKEFYHLHKLGAILTVIAILKSDFIQASLGWQR